MKRSHEMNGQANGEAENIRRVNERKSCMFGSSSREHANRGRRQKLYTRARHLRWATVSVSLQICIYRKRAFDGLLWRMWEYTVQHEWLEPTINFRMSGNGNLQSIIIHVSTLLATFTATMKKKGKENKLTKLTCAQRHGNLIWSLSLMQWGYHFDTDYGFPFLSLL